MTLDKNIKELSNELKKINSNLEKINGSLKAIHDHGLGVCLDESTDMNLKFIRDVLEEFKKDVVFEIKNM